MGNFGFVEGRSATLPGINAKLNEVTAALALAKLRAFAGIVAHRYALERRYRTLLPEFEFQRLTCTRYAPMFVSVLLPPPLAAHRNALRHELLHWGIQTGSYFDPHLSRQPYFRSRGITGDLSVSDDVACSPYQCMTS